MTEKLSLDIPIVLPDVQDDDDACVERLMEECQRQPGIERVHVLAKSDAEVSKLCIHYDPEIIELAQVRSLIRRAGAACTERYGHALWQVQGITHARRARSVEDELRKTQGVLEVYVSASGSIRVEYDRTRISESDIWELLHSLRVSRSTDGTSEIDAVSAPLKRDAHADSDDHSHEHGELLGDNTELIFALVCGALLGIGFGIEKLTADAPSWLPSALYLIAYVFGGYFTLREAIGNLRRKRFEIDTLMLVAAAGAVPLGALAEGALLLFLFSLGHALEHYAMGRAKRAIEALAELAPDTAHVRREGSVKEIPVESLDIGDVVIVRPNERLPADGFLVQGVSNINQAPVTGESIPVDKRPVSDIAAARAKPDQVDASSRVFAGTINGTGAIEIEVTRTSGNSALAKIVKMVSEAESRKSPTQRFTDRFERIFVPAVLGLALALLFAWVVIDEPFSDSFYRAMAVLVAASPCALAIATPSAVLSGVARAARGGVLVKGGAPLEELGSLRAMAFDKTGTLTEGKPRITEIVPAPDASIEELLSVAVAVEALSDHPLALALARDGGQRLQGRPIPSAGDLQSLTGRGVSARVNGLPAWVGKAGMFGVDGVPELGEFTSAAISRLSDAGHTTMAVRLGARDLGVIGMMDTPRPHAREVLQQLRALGITRMIMISGDHPVVAKAVATQVGLDEAWGGLMPDDKVKAIRELKEQAKVAMVGDGVNDAPAMANATVGIAMGAAGSDVALETADVALMTDDLRRLPFAVALSWRTRAVIRQNVFVSLGVVAFLVPATILGLGIGPAVAIHEGSTLLVVVNALRLLAYRSKDDVSSDPGTPASR